MTSLSVAPRRCRVPGSQDPQYLDPQTRSWQAQAIADVVGWVTASAWLPDDYRRS